MEAHQLHEAVGMGDTSADQEVLVRNKADDGLGEEQNAVEEARGSCTSLEPEQREEEDPQEDEDQDSLNDAGTRRGDLPRMEQ